MFNHKASIQAITNLWYHTFQVKLPRLDWETERDRKSQNNIQRCMLSEHKRTKLECGAFERNADFVTRLHKQGYDSLHKITNAIHSLFPTIKARQEGVRNDHYYQQSGRYYTEHSDEPLKPT